MQARTIGVLDSIAQDREFRPEIESVGKRVVEEFQSAIWPGTDVCDDTINKKPFARSASRDETQPASNAARRFI